MPTERGLSNVRGNVRVHYGPEGKIRPVKNSQPLPIKPMRITPGTGYYGLKPELIYDCTAENAVYDYILKTVAYVDVNNDNNDEIVVIAHNKNSNGYELVFFSYDGVKFNIEKSIPLDGYANYLDSATNALTIAASKYYGFTFILISEYDPVENVNPEMVLYIEGFNAVQKLFTIDKSYVTLGVADIDNDGVDEFIVADFSPGKQDLFYIDIQPDVYNPSYVIKYLTKAPSKDVSFYSVDNAVYIAFVRHDLRDVDLYKIYPGADNRPTFELLYSISLDDLSRRFGVNIGGFIMQSISDINHDGVDEFVFTALISDVGVSKIVYVPVNHIDDYSYYELGPDVFIFTKIITADVNGDYYDEIIASDFNKPLYYFVYDDDLERFVNYVAGSTEFFKLGLLISWFKEAANIGYYGDVITACSLVAQNEMHTTKIYWVRFHALTEVAANIDAIITNADNSKVFVMDSGGVVINPATEDTLAAFRTDFGNKIPQPFQFDQNGRVLVNADLQVSDIEIGAVEIKDADTDNRAKVDSNGDLHVFADNPPLAYDSTNDWFRQSIENDNVGLAKDATLQQALPRNLTEVSGVALTGRDWSQDFAKLPEISTKLDNVADRVLGLIVLSENDVDIFVDGGTTYTDLQNMFDKDFTTYGTITFPDGGEFIIALKYPHKISRVVFLSDSNITQLNYAIEYAEGFEDTGTVAPIADYGGYIIVDPTKTVTSIVLKNNTGNDITVNVYEMFINTALDVYAQTNIKYVNGVPQSGRDWSADFAHIGSIDEKIVYKLIPNYDKVFKVTEDAGHLLDYSGIDTPENVFLCDTNVGSDVTNTSSASISIKLNKPTRIRNLLILYKITGSALSTVSWNDHAEVSLADGTTVTTPTQNHSITLSTTEKYVASIFSLNGDFATSFKITIENITNATSFKIIGTYYEIYANTVDDIMDVLQDIHEILNSDTINPISTYVLSHQTVNTAGQSDVYSAERIKVAEVLIVVKNTNGAPNMTVALDVIDSLTGEIIKTYTSDNITSDTNTYIYVVNDVLGDALRVRWYGILDDTNYFGDVTIKLIAKR